MSSDAWGTQCFSAGSSFGSLTLGGFCGLGPAGRAVRLPWVSHGGPSVEKLPKHAHSWQVPGCSGMSQGQSMLCPTHHMLQTLPRGSLYLEKFNLEKHLHEASFH